MPRVEKHESNLTMDNYYMTTSVSKGKEPVYKIYCKDKISDFYKLIQKIWAKIIGVEYSYGNAINNVLSNTSKGVVYDNNLSYSECKSAQLLFFALKNCTTISTAKSVGGLNISLSHKLDHDGLD